MMSFPLASTGFRQTNRCQQSHGAVFFGQPVVVAPNDLTIGFVVLDAPADARVVVVEAQVDGVREVQIGDMFELGLPYPIAVDVDAVFSSVTNVKEF